MDKEKVNAEVLGVLMASGDAIMCRIPAAIIEYLNSNCDKEQIPHFDPNKTIEEYELSKDARTFLTILKLQYLIDSDEEKKEYIKGLMG